MTAHLPPARTWPLDHRLPVLAQWPADGRNRMIDLSSLPRFGLRGSGTSAWLTGHGCPLPATIHHSLSHEGMTVVRLGQEEVVLLADPVHGWAPLSQLQRDWQAAKGPKGYDAYRQEGWCWLSLTGPDVQQALPLLTSVDTRAEVFGPGAVVQTRALHMDAVLRRHQRGGQPGLDLLFDVASADYAADFFADVLPGFEMARLPG